MNNLNNAKKIKQLGSRLADVELEICRITSTKCIKIKIESIDYIFYDNTEEYIQILNILKKDAKILKEQIKQLVEEL